MAWDGWAEQALVFTAVDIVLCLFSRALVLCTFKKGRLRWKFAPRFLVEEAIIFLLRVPHIVVVISVALRMDGTPNPLMQRLWSDLRLAFEVALVSL